MNTRIGIRTIRKIQQVEEFAASLGFKFQKPDSSYYSFEDDLIGLGLVDDRYPIFRRDVDIFVGTLHDIEVFLTAFEWTTDYYKNINATSDAIILKKEQSIRNKMLLKKIVSNEEA